jgi:hypothetical protein
LQPREDASTKAEKTWCEKEIDRINTANAERSKNEKGWAPTDIGDECELHHFVSKQAWPDDLDKPHASALSQQGMSVIVAGGEFASLSQFEIKSAILATNQKDLAGAIYFTAKAVRELGYTVLHDPNDFYDSKRDCFEKQAPNHAEIICKKDKAKKMDRLRDICVPSLTPAAFEKLNLDEQMESKPALKLINSNGSIARETSSNRMIGFVIAMIFILCTLLACLIMFD